MTPEEFAENLKKDIDNFVKTWEQGVENLKNDIDEFVKTWEKGGTKPQGGYIPTTSGDNKPSPPGDE